MTRNSFKGSTDFDLMLLLNEISQWLENEPPAERGDRNSSAVALQQGYDPPHRACPFAVGCDPCRLMTGSWWLSDLGDWLGPVLATHHFGPKLG